MRKTNIALHYTVHKPISVHFCNITAFLIGAVLAFLSILICTLLCFVCMVVLFLRGRVRPLASILDERRAMIVTRYLASGRALSNSFDMYLQQVCSMSSNDRHALHNTKRVKYGLI